MLVADEDLLQLSEEVDPELQTNIEDPSLLNFPQTKKHQLLRRVMAKQGTVGFHLYLVIFFVHYFYK